MILMYIGECWCVVMCVCFFFKQKTAYEMRISDWSSDVCSSDLCRISLGRQHATEIIAGCTALFVHFRDQAGIVGGIGDNCDAFMILCRGTHHGGAANVDILYDFVPVGAPRDGLRKGIEIDNNQVDSTDVMLLH